MDNKSRCENDYRYATTMHFMKQLKAHNIISTEDYGKLEEVFAEKHNPSFRLYRISVKEE